MKVDLDPVTEKYMIDHDVKETTLVPCKYCGKLYKATLGHECSEKPVRMTLEEIWTGEKPKKNKYHNKKVVRDGMIFDSEHECQRWYELKLMEKNGEITDLQRQVKFNLIPPQDGERAVNYIADFVYHDKDGQRVVEDAKGCRTKEYIIKRKLMLYKYAVRITEV